MLILSRKKDQSIIIDENIKVMVIEIRGEKVRLGFEAPGDVQVHREEVWVQIEKEAKQALPHTDG